MTSRNSLKAKALSRARIFGATSLIALSTVFANAEPADTYKFELKPQPLAEALIEFSEKTNVVITVRSDLLAGKTSPAIMGEMSAKGALSYLLQNTAYEVIEQRNGTIIIRDPNSNNISLMNNISLSADAEDVAHYEENLAGDDDSSSESDGDNVAFEEVIVTGSRTGRALNKIPGAVSIISQTEIKRDLSLTSDITAMLARTVPGYGESKQQLDRNGETLRGRVALRLLDGVPQGSPLRDGSRDNVFTDMGIVSRVEIINGPSATEGIGASGGIINYITKTPTEMGTEVQISTQYRSQFKDDSDSWRVALNIAHKAEDYDLLVAGSFSETGIAYDGVGDLVGIGTRGSNRDSQSDNLFIKIGTNFGDGDEQRLEISHSRFVIESQNRYRLYNEHPEISYKWHRINKVKQKSIKESPPGGLGSFNDFKQTALTYTHDDFFGGKLWIQAYNADQAMRFESERDLGKQDPDFAPFTLDDDGFPVGPLPLVEQSEIDSQKEGLRSSWSTDSLFGTEGLGLQIGADYVKDTAQQRLAIQNKTWVPPMEYTSFAPFAQVSLDIDSLTITGGLRHEDGKLKVDDYTTSWANDRRFVSGGEINYGKWLPNIGAIWRVNDQWSIYTSFSRGFTLPNAGIPLRNIRCSNDTSEKGDPSDPINNPFGGIQPDGCPNDDPISVNDIVDLEAIIVDNIEVGFSWTGENGKFGISLFESTSEFGAKLVSDPDVGDFVLSRKPEKIQGIEITSMYNVSEELSLSAIYASITGKTPFASDGSGPLDRELGVININPNKLVITADWQFSEDGNVVLGSATIFNRDTNVDTSKEENIKGHTTFNMSVNHQVGQGMLSLGISNLLDKQYIISTQQVKSIIAGRGREFTLSYVVSY